MTVLLYAIQLFPCIDFVPFLFYNVHKNRMYVRKWRRIKMYIKKKNTQGALSWCPQLHQGDFANVLPLYQPEPLELWEPLDIHHKLGLLVEATPDVSLLQCLRPLLEHFFYYCSKVSLQWFSHVVGELLAQVLLWRQGQGIDPHWVWYRQGAPLFPSLLVWAVEVF